VFLRRRPLLHANRDNPQVAAQRQVMLDVDSTVFPLIDAIAEHIGDPTLTTDRCTSWDSLPQLLGGVDRMMEVFEEVMTYETMMRHGVYPGVRETVEALHAHNVKIHINTHRPSSVAEDTARYLRDQGIHFDSFHCELGTDKVGFCRERGIEVLVDDHPDTLRSAVEHGLEGLALRYPFNEEVLRRHGLRHATDWRQLGHHVLDAVEERVLRALTHNASSAYLLDLADALHDQACNSRAGSAPVQSKLAASSSSTSNL
jgi:uncharacterized HAD superfamily protein